VCMMRVGLFIDIFLSLYIYNINDSTSCVSSSGMEMRYR
jgi:hypothetical protein